MNTKHTPGPWVAEKRDGDEWWFGGKDGAEIVIRTGIGATWTTDDGDADARLIAAAPELLEIARDVVELINGELVGADWKRACHELVRRANAAIAKATGEQQ